MTSSSDSSVLMSTPKASPSDVDGVAHQVRLQVDRLAGRRGAPPALFEALGHPGERREIGLDVPGIEARHHHRSLPPPRLAVGGEHAVEAHVVGDRAQAFAAMEAVGPVAQQRSDGLRVCHREKRPRADAEAEVLAVGAAPRLGREVQPRVAQLQQVAEDRQPARPGSSLSFLNCTAENPTMVFHEDRDVERQRHPRASGAVLRVAGTRPADVCLQELKAETAQIPEACKVADYHTFWHGMRAYSGVSLHIRKNAFLENLSLPTPRSTWIAHRAGGIRQARPRLGLRAERQQGLPGEARLFRRLITWAKELREAGRELILCGDMNITRTEMDVHPKERKPGSSVSGRRSASSSASC